MNKSYLIILKYHKHDFQCFRFVKFGLVFVNTIILYYSSLSIFTRPYNIILNNETIILTSDHLLCHRQYNINRV